MEGKKYDTGKPSMALIPHSAVAEIARVLDFGAAKYDADNWRKGIKWRRVISAAERHIGAFKDGEDIDPESGLPHLAHAGCCILFLLTYMKERPEFDDRYKGDE